jgi:hypothetical protein
VAFTYTPGTSRGRVRQTLSDTVEESSQFSDAEIDDALSLYTSVAAASAYLARVLYMRLARRARDYTSDQGSVNETANLAYLQDLAEKLEAEAATVTPTSTLPLAVVGTLGRAPNDPYYTTGS